MLSPGTSPHFCPPSMGVCNPSTSTGMAPKGTFDITKIVPTRNSGSDLDSLAISYFWTLELWHCGLSSYIVRLGHFQNSKLPIALILCFLWQLRCYMNSLRPSLRLIKFFSRFHIVQSPYKEFPEVTSMSRTTSIDVISASTISG